MEGQESSGLQAVTGNSRSHHTAHWIVLSEIELLGESKGIFCEVHADFGMISEVEGGCGDIMYTPHAHCSFYKTAHETDVGRSMMGPSRSGGAIEGRLGAVGGCGEVSEGITAFAAIQGRLWGCCGGVVGCLRGSPQLQN